LAWLPESPIGRLGHPVTIPRAISLASLRLNSRHCGHCRFGDKKGLPALRASAPVFKK
jgi:hypothetical protein